jgi:hypothetical protein
MRVRSAVSVATAIRKESVSHLHLLDVSTYRYHLCHYYGMAIRTTVDIPEPLHDRLRNRAASSGTSIRSLIVRALEEAYTDTGKKEAVTGPLIRGSGKLGPQFPRDENPHDLVFS